MRAIRLAAGLVVIAVLVGVAVFFAGHPGRVVIVWQGWQVETSVGVLAAAAVLLALAAAALLRLLRLVGRSPRAASRWRRERRRADALLADPPLTLLLSAQAAQLDGDENAAKKFFTAMLDRPETEFLGLRGLINQALRAEESGKALELAERARRLRPDTRWVTQSLFDLEVRDGRWQAALDTLAQMVRRRLIPADRGRHHRGVVFYELSRAAIADGDRRRGTKLAAAAQRLAPDLPAPAAHYARLLLEAGQSGPAAKAVERAWRTAPNPELAQVYDAIHRAAPPLARLKRFERLAAQNPEARESHLALAEAALAAQLWGEVRRRLEQAMKAEPTPPAPAGGAPTPRLCLMMARLEEVEHQDFARVREWLDRAVTAPPDPRHVCSDCGGESLEWRSRCPHCGNFDTLFWRTPASSGVGTLLPAAVDAAAPPAPPPQLPAASAAAE
jgi:HemY protein